jgi:hypothetical protein
MGVSGLGSSPSETRYQILGCRLQMQEICRLLDLDLGAGERGEGPESASVFTMRKNKTGTVYSGNAGKCKSRVSALRWDAGL